MGPRPIKITQFDAGLILQPAPATFGVYLVSKLLQLLAVTASRAQLPQAQGVRLHHCAFEPHKVLAVAYICCAAGACILCRDRNLLTYNGRSRGCCCCCFYPCCLLLLSCLVYSFFFVCVLLISVVHGNWACLQGACLAP